MKAVFVLALGLLALPSTHPQRLHDDDMPKDAAPVTRRHGKIEVKYCMS